MPEQNRGKRIIRKYRGKLTYADNIGIWQNINWTNGSKVYPCQYMDLDGILIFKGEVDSDSSVVLPSSYTKLALISNPQMGYWNTNTHSTTNVYITGSKIQLQTVTSFSQFSTKISGIMLSYVK